LLTQKWIVETRKATPMATSDAPTADRAHSGVAAIRRLNDEFRSGLSRGRLMITQGVRNLPAFELQGLMQAIAAYDNFTPETDPYDERDFGSMELFEAKIFWKIDYYDQELEAGSPNPADGSVTARVLTVMLASEY
jgi:hypothetical protein